MAFRNSYPKLDIEDWSSAGALRRRCISPFTVLFGLVATMNVVSVVFVLLE